MEDDELDLLLRNERYPRSARYSARWMVDGAMGQNTVWQAGDVGGRRAARGRHRVLGLGCGTALWSDLSRQGVRRRGVGDEIEGEPPTACPGEPSQGAGAAGTPADDRPPARTSPTQTSATATSAVRGFRLMLWPWQRQVGFVRIERNIELSVTFDLDGLLRPGSRVVRQPRVEGESRARGVPGSCRRRHVRARHW